jgi:hypothetical protein
MPVVHNMRSVILYHDKRARPETLKKIQKAIDSGENATMIAVDPMELDSFTQLIFFEPEITRVVEEKLGVRESEEAKAKRLNAERQAERNSKKSK